MDNVLQTLATALSWQGDIRPMDQATEVVCTRRCPRYLPRHEVRLQARRPRFDIVGARSSFRVQVKRPTDNLLDDPVM
jgi:hypothetical protein